MPPAIIGGVIAGVGAIGGAIIGGNAQGDAIEDASDAQAASSAAAIQFQREARDQNVAIQTPFLNTGMAAMGNINALLGLNVPQATATPTPPVSQPLPSGSGSGGGGPFGSRFILDRIEARIQAGEDVPPRLMDFYNANRGQNTTTPAPQGTVTAPVSQTSAQDAYNAFKNYTGYTSRINEANDSFNSRAAGTGTLQSGAALIARDRMNQDYVSNEFGNYLGYLGGQQQLGPGAANALSGVATNYANQAGNIAMNQGNNLASAAIANGNNTANMWSGIAGGLGGMAGSLFPGSSFSDRRLKKDIVELGIRPDGLTAFEWTYKHDPEAKRYQGVMADEVKVKRPEAYIPNYRGTGFDGVDYGKLAA